MKRFNKIIASALALCIFYSAAVVPFAEANLWQDRRKAAQNLQLAQLPATPSALPGSLQSLPAAAPITASADNPGERPESAANGAIPEAVRTIPLNLVNVRGAFFPPAWKAGDPLVVHLQDVHMNRDAQKNIGSAIQHLMARGAVDLVALEGAFEALDLAAFRELEDQEAVRQVADYLLKNDQITGALHAALIAPGRIPAFVGVDDSAHYHANVDAYKRSHERSPELKAALQARAASTAKEKAERFNPALLEFDRSVQDYRDGKIQLGAFAGILASRSGSVAPETRAFLKAVEMEASLDFARVERERKEVIRRLVNALDQNKTAELMRLSLAYRLGRVKHGDFYARLRDLCRANGVRLEQFPAMQGYIRYVLISDTIDASKLFDQMQDMEASAYRALARTDDERELVERSRAQHLSGKLLDFALSPREWIEYRKLPARQDLDASGFESFFQEAMLRDEAISANLLASMRARGAKSAVLVTGGFHSEGIESRLRAANVAFVTLSPKMTKVDAKNGSAYLSVFAREKSPLQKLFDGDKLFVTQQVYPSSLRLTLAAVLTMLIIPRGAGLAQANALFRHLAGRGAEAYRFIRASAFSAVLDGPQGAVRIEVSRSETAVEDIRETPRWQIESALTRMAETANAPVAGLRGLVTPSTREFLKANLDWVPSDFREPLIRLGAGTIELFETAGMRFIDVFLNRHEHSQMRSLRANAVSRLAAAAAVAVPLVIGWAVLHAAGLPVPGLPQLPAWVPAVSAAGLLSGLLISNARRPVERLRDGPNSGYYFHAPGKEHRYFGSARTQRKLGLGLIYAGMAGAFAVALAQGDASSLDSWIRAVNSAFAANVFVHGLIYNLILAPLLRMAPLTRSGNGMDELSGGHGAQRRVNRNFTRGQRPAEAVPVTIQIPSMWRQAAGVHRVPLNAATVGDALRALIEMHPRLGPAVLPDGRVPPHINVYLSRQDGDENVSDDLDLPLQPDDRLFIIPMFAGGSDDAEFDAQFRQLQIDDWYAQPGRSYRRHVFVEEFLRPLFATLLRTQGSEILFVPDGKGGNLLLAGPPDGRLDEKISIASFKKTRQTELAGVYDTERPGTGGKRTVWLFLDSHASAYDAIQAIYEQEVEKLQSQNPPGGSLRTGDPFGIVALISLSILLYKVGAVAFRAIVRRVHEARAPAADADRTVRALERVRQGREKGADQEAAAELIAALLDELPTAHELGGGLHSSLSQPSGSTALQAAAEALMQHLAAPDRLGDKRFARGLKSSLARSGYRTEAEIRAFLASALAPGLQVYFVDRKDWQADPAKWARIVSVLDAYFGQRAAVVTDHADVQAAVLDIAPDMAVVLTDQAFGEEEAHSRPVDLAAIQNASVNGVPLAKHPAMTFHASRRLRLIAAGLDERTAQALIEAARMVMLIESTLDGLPLKPTDLDLIDRVIQAVMTSA